MDPKGRFEVRDGRIRARYGHSFPVELGYEPTGSPPGILYHGTSIDRVQRILAEGLKPMKRLYVHLSADTGTACETGARHGVPVVVVVDTSVLKRLGVEIYRASPLVYLAEHVPREAIIGVEEC